MNNNYSLAPIQISPEEFLGAFFEPAETVCLRIFSDGSDSEFFRVEADSHARFK